jgi:hypothetical protein
LKEESDDERRGIDSNSLSLTLPGRGQLARSDGLLPLLLQVIDRAGGSSIGQQGRRLRRALSLLIFILSSWGAFLRNLGAKEATINARYQPSLLSLTTTTFRRKNMVIPKETALSIARLLAFQWCQGRFVEGPITEDRTRGTVRYPTGASIHEMRSILIIGQGFVNRLVIVCACCDILC